MPAPVEPATLPAPCRRALTAARMGSGTQRVPARYDLFYLLMGSSFPLQHSEEGFFFFSSYFALCEYISNSETHTHCYYTSHRHVCLASLIAAPEPTGATHHGPWLPVCQKPINASR